MIALHAAVTDSGLQSLILLEELGLPYTFQRLDPVADLLQPSESLVRGAMKPVPFIYDDSNNLTLHESGAILLYLAEKTRRLLPVMPQARACAYQWLFASTALASGSPDTDAIRARLAALNDVLVERNYLVGDFSLADIACYPLVERYSSSLVLDSWHALKNWLTRMGARPAVMAAHAKMTVT
ncbi:MAG: glutathione S-transferase family protein [Gammaproteobacteria bacterium]